MTKKELQEERLHAINNMSHFRLLKDNLMYAFYRNVYKQAGAKSSMSESEYYSRKEAVIESCIKANESFLCTT